jgi:hypothetical protein
LTFLLYLFFRSRFCLTIWGNLADVDFFVLHVVFLIQIQCSFKITSKFCLLRDGPLMDFFRGLLSCGMGRGVGGDLAADFSCPWWISLSQNRGL